MSSSEGPLLADALAGLDLLIHREILRLRARYQLSLDEFRGLYISDEQVDLLVRRTASPITLEAPEHSFCDALPTMIVRHGRLAHLTRCCGLSALEASLLFVAVAPCLDPKYGVLYGYLNNDVSRKALSVDLATRLLGRTTEVRGALQPGSRLLECALLEAGHGSELSASGLQTLIIPHPGVADFLLGLPFRDPRIDRAMEILPFEASPVSADAAIGAMARRLERTVAPQPTRVVVIEPSRSLTARSCAAALAAAGCRSLAVLDLRAVPREHLADHLPRALLMACLSEAILLVEGAERLSCEARVCDEAVALRILARPRQIPALLAVPQGGLVGLPYRSPELLSIRAPELAPETSRRLWSVALADHGLEAGEDDLRELSRRFTVSPELVDSAVQCMGDASQSAGSNQTQITRDALFAAARSQSDDGLGRLAQRVPLRHSWSDLVLPAVTRDCVRGLVEALRARDRVLDDWGLGRSLGTVGLRALFAGPSGTGKTMTAAVIGRELGLDVYRIDLSQTVSKYIGETEKNLERIFQAAERANGILFFDEAEALLGKRSEVREAHDRYANVEVAYLLQRLEEFAGTAIVATNISRNIDPAFSRRMQFVIEFPIPGPAERERLWRAMLPPTAPLATDIDFEFLGRRFDLSGGDIRNVVLDAAFLAARHDRSIGMPQIAKALARQLLKQGKAPSATEFRQHFPLLAATDHGG